jgi:hypothetical protein
MFVGTEKISDLLPCRGERQIPHYATLVTRKSKHELKYKSEQRFACGEIKNGYVEKMTNKIKS